MDKKKKRLNIGAIVRRLIQLASFVLIPGLFIDTFSAIKDVYVSIIQGSFSASALSYQLILLIAVIPITIFLGRFFCGYLCAFGSMGDLLWFVSRKLRKKPLVIGERADKALKLLKFVVLGFLVVFVWTLGLISFSATDSPWTIFGMYASIAGWPSATYLLSIGAGLLLLIMIGSMLIERFFCRYLCPLGAVFTIISLPRLFRIKKPRQDCGACRLCTKNCSMGISLFRSNYVNSGECINCFECMRVCPRQNVSANPTPATATVMATAAITGLYYLGNLTASVAEAAATTSQVEAVVSLSPTVTSNNAALSAALAAAASASTAAAQGADEVTSSTAATSGTTSSSAAKASSTPSSSSASSSTSAASASTSAADASATPAAASASATTTTTATESTSTGAYKDGTYTGTGTGFRGTTKVTVTVSGGKITAITVVSYQDDAKWFTRAKSTIISEILQSQDIDVSAVSGATFSSNGLIEAVADALSLDFTNPNSSLARH